MRAAVAPAELAARRAALAHRDRLSDGELREALTLARALGNRDEAGYALELLHGRARARLGLARASGEAPAAETAWHAERRRLTVAARQLGEPEVLLSILTGALDAPDNADDLAWAVGRLNYIYSPEVYRAAIDLFADDAEARVALERKKPYGQEVPLLTFEEILDAGDRELLTGHLADAATAADESTVWRAAEALVALDEWHLGARLALLARTELGSGRLERRTSLLTDLVHLDTGSVAHGQMEPMARLLLDRDTHPRASAPALALAFRAARAGLIGDTHALVHSIPGDANDDARELARAIGALATLAAGDTDGYRDWADGADAADSVFISSFELDLERDDAPPALVQLAGESRRRAVQRGDDVPWWSRTRMLADPEVNFETRRRALPEYYRDDPAFDLPLAVCVDGSLDAQACNELIDATFALDDPDDGEGNVRHGLATLAPLAGFPERWLWSATHIEAAEFADLDSVLDGLERTPLGLTESYAGIRVLLAISKGDAIAAAARLDAARHTLATRWRMAARLAVADVSDGTSDGAEAFDAFWTPADFSATIPDANPLSDDRRQQIEEWYPGDGRQAQLNRGLAYYRHGAFGDALATLTPLAKSLEGDELLEVYPYLSIAHSLTGATEAASAALARMQEIDAHAFPTVFVAGWLGERRGEHELALGHLSAAVSRQPDATAATDALVACLGALYPGPEGAHRIQGLLEALAPLHGHYESARATLALAAPVDGARAATIYRALHDGEAAWRLGATAANIASLREQALGWLHQQLDDASPADVSRLATDAIAFLETVSPPEPVRDMLAWMHLLAGDGARTLAVARAGELEPWEPVVLLAAGRPRRIDDALALDLWRAHHTHQDDGVEPAQRLLAQSPSEQPLLEYLCRVFVDADLTDIALDPCWRAFERGPVNTSLAAAVSWLLLARPEEAEKRGIDPEAFFTRPGSHLADKDDATWLVNYGYWLLSVDRVREAAAVQLRGWAGGFDVGRHGLTEEAAASYAPVLGLPMRLLTRLGSSYDTGDTLALAGLQSLQSGDRDAATMYAAAAQRWGVGPAGVGSLAYLVPDLVELLDADLEHERIDVEGARRVVAIAAAGADVSKLEALARSYPSAHLVSVFLLEYHFLAGNHATASSLARALLEAHPSNVLVVQNSISILYAQGRLQESRAVLARALAVHPDDPRLAQIQLPEHTETKTTVPPWATTGADFTAALIAAPRIPESSRRASIEQAAEAYFPESWQPSVRFAFGFASPGEAWMAVTTISRASRCEPERCLELFLPTLEKAGFETLWRQPVELGAGAAAEALLAGPAQMVWVGALAFGGRVYVLTAGGTTDGLHAALPALRLLRDSFRPLDFVLGPTRAEAVRANAWDMPADDVRLRARRESASDRPCPIRELFDGLDDSAQASLLLDTYLTSGSDEVRLNLIACAEPKEDLAARLGLVTLISEHDSLHQYGRAVAQSHPKQTRRDAEVALLGVDEAAVSSHSIHAVERLPPYGVLEVLAALPAAERRSFGDSLLRSSDTRQHALGLAAATITDDVVPTGLLHAEIRKAPAAIATLAVLALPPRPSAEALAAARARLSDLGTPTDLETLALATTIARVLAPRLEAEDSDRLLGTATRVRDALAATEPSAEALSEAGDLLWYAEAHARGLALATGSAVSTDPKYDATIEKWSRRRVNIPDATPVDTSALSQRPLPELVRGEGWTYVRLARPALFAATAREIYRRLQATSDVDTVYARHSVEAMTRRNGGAMLTEKSGLDLTRPIECLAPGGRHVGFVCSAWVEDAARVRQALSQRAAGHDAGVVLPLNLATVGSTLPGAMSILPALLQSALYTRREGGGRGQLVAERVRTSKRIGPHELDHFAVLELNEGYGATSDAELYLFIGDRLLAFSGEELAREILFDLPRRAETFASSRRFTRTTRDWTDGGALRAAVLAGASPMVAHDTSIAIALDADGAVFRFDSHDDTSYGDVGPLLARLPDGAVSTLALAPGPRPQFELSDLELPPPTEEIGPVPPAWLLHTGATLAFGWYAQPGDLLWARWVAVATLSDTVERAWRQRGLPLPETGATATHDGLSIARDGNLVLVGSNSELVRAAVEKKAAPSPITTHRVIQSTLDGPRAALFLHELARSFRAGDARADLARFWATLVGVTRRVSLTGHWDAESKRSAVEARLDANLAPADVDLAVLEQWLASPIKNAINLPRNVASHELRAPLEVVFEVDDAANVAKRVFPQTARTATRVMDERRLEIRIDPALDLDAPVARAPLRDDDRRRLLTSDRHIRANADEVRAVVRRILSPRATPVAAARVIVDWVHQHMAYELTPDQLDAVAVLERARGDCTEYSVLTVALLRAAGVPAELRQGFIVAGREVVMHAWVAFHDGEGWREIEPTNGRAYVGSGHVESSVMDFVSLVSLGRIKVVKIGKPTR